MAAFRRALKSLVSAADTDYSKKHPEFFVGLEGSFGSRHVTPRSLTSEQLGNIVCLEGIVTKCKWSERFVNFCEKTHSTYLWLQQDWGLRGSSVTEHKPIFPRQLDYFPLQFLTYLDFVWLSLHDCKLWVIWSSNQQLLPCPCVKVPVWFVIN